MLSSVLLCLGLVASAVVARPASTREVVAPPITFPTASTVWTVGEKTHVDWDTSVLPPYNQITNSQGRVVLGHRDPCDPNPSEHLDYDHPLAEGFNITVGAVPVTVPNVPPRSDYIIVLFGDSGNASPAFVINIAISDGSGKAPPARAVCTSSTTSDKSSSTSTSFASASTSMTTTKSTTSPVSDLTTVATTTFTSISTQPTPTTSGTGSVSSLSNVSSGSVLASSGSFSGTSVRPTALPQSQSISAIQSQSTSSASFVATNWLVAVLSGVSTVLFAVL